MLCTPTQTFQIRQVQTSNSLLVSRPASLCHPSDSSVSCLSAISQCPATIELLPETGSPLPLLRQTLLEYNSSDDLTELVTTHQEKTKLDIFADVPFSNAECEEAWRNVCAFEASGHCWRPSAKAQIEAWRAILATATTEGINLESSFELNDLLNALVQEDHPTELFKGILLFLSPEIKDSEDRWCRIDRSVCIPWVGKTTICANVGEDQNPRPISKATLMASWRDSLFEAWRGEAELELIKDDFCDVASDQIIFKPQISSGMIGNGTGAPEKKRKWHDMLTAGRK